MANSLQSCSDLFPIEMKLLVTEVSASFHYMHTNAAHQVFQLFLAFGD